MGWGEGSIELVPKCGSRTSAGAAVAAMGSMDVALCYDDLLAPPPMWAPIHPPGPLPIKGGLGQATATSGCRQPGRRPNWVLTCSTVVCLLPPAADMPQHRPAPLWATCGHADPFQAHWRTLLRKRRLDVRSANASALLTVRSKRPLRVRRLVSKSPGMVTCGRRT
jgi:hypothetical protein